jgi:hypothetical protein
MQAKRHLKNKQAAYINIIERLKVLREKTLTSFIKISLPLLRD